ncbi:MAG: hypothetical protein LUD29_06375 [Clostridia bacterium]|nr:hypothetical protein [Clostridia bacterium]
MNHRKLRNVVYVIWVTSEEMEYLNTAVKMSGKGRRDFFFSLAQNAPKNPACVKSEKSVETMSDILEGIKASWEKTTEKADAFLRGGDEREFILAANECEKWLIKARELLRARTGKTSCR